MSRTSKLTAFRIAFVTGRFIAAANPVAMHAILNQRDRGRGEAARREQRTARLLGIIHVASPQGETAASLGSLLHRAFKSRRVRHMSPWVVRACQTK